jgi:hypothetical protein
MRFGSFRLVSIVPLLSFLVAGCGGSDGGTDPDPDPIATTVTITSGVIDLTEIGQTATITATVQDQNGRQIPGAPLSFSSGSTAVVTVTSGGVVTAAGEGSTAITVTSGSASETVTATVTLSTLALGQPIGGLSLAGGELRTFTLELGAGTGATALLDFAISGSNGDADLFVRRGAAPDLANGIVDCVSQSELSSEACAFASAQAGTWYVTVGAFAAFSGLELVARTVEPTPVTLGTPISDLSGATGSSAYFSLNVPAHGAPAAGPERTIPNRVVLSSELKGGHGDVRGEAAPGSAEADPQLTDGSSLEIAISGGTGDADLFASPSQPASRTPFVGIECFPFLEGNAESCSITDPAAGRWIVAIAGFQTYAGVTLAASFTPGTGGPTPGTITIQKAVQSSSGGAADNPANPSLAGFEFEVRPAGGGSVVGTGTTNASGVAQISLAAGSYDVTEANSQGLTDFTAAANGVTVTAGGNTDVAWVNRQSAPSGNGVPVAVIEGAPSSIPSGDANQTEVRLYGGNSTDPDGDPLTYSWSAPGGTFIGSTNLQTARVTFPGGTARTVSLTVSDGTDQNTAQFQIAGPGPLPAAGTFDIEIVPIAPITDPEAQAAFDLAEATWESIIRSELQNINFAGTPVPADACLTGQPAINDEVDDLRIYVEFEPNDGPGGTLASAGPCVVRTGGTATTIVGIMSFDSDDFGNLSASALNRVILHEMAHVLGFGTLWGRNGQLINPSCPDGPDEDSIGDCSASDPPGPDTRFTGSLASAAYRALGGVANANVPVENAQGGPGTRDGHWRESIFGLELMTGFLTSNVANPLSLLTVAALDDSGLAVDYSTVDNYSIAGTAPFPAPGEPGVIDLREDLHDGPIWAVDADGTLVLVRAGR